MGWGAEVLARCVETLGPAVRAARRLAAQEIPIPVAKSLEADAIPGVQAVAVKGLFAEYIEEAIVRREFFDLKIGGR